RVNSFLKHALFVAHDDVGRTQFDQALQTIVAVDDTAVEIVEVGRREAATVERHERTQFRRNHRNDVQDHPLRTVTGFEEALNDLETLDDLLGLQLGLRNCQLFKENLLLSLEIEAFEQLLDRLGADTGGEGVFAVLVLCLKQLILGEELEALERRKARLDDDELFEVQHALQL